MNKEKIAIYEELKVSDCCGAEMFRPTGIIARHKRCRKCKKPCTPVISHLKGRIEELKNEGEAT